MQNVKNIFLTLLDISCNKSEKFDVEFQKSPEHDGAFDTNLKNNAALGPEK